MFSIIHATFYPMECVDVHYKVVHNALFTRERLYRYNMSDTDKCPVCLVDVEDMLHLFIKCPKISDLKNYICDIIENLFRNALNACALDKIILLGFLGMCKYVNVDFVHFILSVARYCIFKRRNLVISNEGYVDVQNFFKFTIRTFTSYALSYYVSRHKTAIFQKYFLNSNPMLRVENNCLVYDL